MGWRTRGSVAPFVAPSRLRKTTIYFIPSLFTYTVTFHVELSSNSEKKSRQRGHSCSAKASDRGKFNYEGKRPNDIGQGIFQGAAA